MPEPRDVRGLHATGFLAVPTLEVDPIRVAERPDGHPDPEALVSHEVSVDTRRPDHEVADKNEDHRCGKDEQCPLPKGPAGNRCGQTAGIVPKRLDPGNPPSRAAHPTPASVSR